MRWPLRNFYTFYHLVDSYRNTISKWAVGFGYGNFTLKLARGKQKPCLPRAYGPWANFKVKKFPYLKLGPFGNPIFIPKIQLKP